MTGITKFEAYISLFNITEENKEIELYTHSSDDEFSFVELEDRVAEVLGLSDVSFLILQHEIHGPNIFKTYRKDYQWKRARLMVNMNYQGVMLNHHFEILKGIPEF